MRSASASCTGGASPRSATTWPRDARGRGLATAALRLLSRWALDTLPVVRLQLTTHQDNPASQRVAQKAGYTREALLRAWADQRGTRVDLVMWSLLPGDLDP